MDAPIFYHEDFYRQIEFVPEENYFAVGRDMEELPPRGGAVYGFDNMTLRPEQTITLLDRKISHEEVKEILSPMSLLYSENILTGYGQSSWKDKNTAAWGFERYGIFIKKKGGLVEAIWLSHSALFSQLNTGKQLTAAIFGIATKYSLILVDWNQELICRVRSQEDVKVYLQQNLSYDFE